MFNTLGQKILAYAVILSKTSWKDIVALKYILTKTQLANIFTKPLDAQKYIHFRSAIGLCTVE